MPTDPSSLYCPSPCLPTPSSVLNWTHSGYIYTPMWGTWETPDANFHSPDKTTGSTWLSLPYEIPGRTGTTPRAPSRKEGKKGRESPRMELGSNHHERPSPEAGGLRAVLLDKKWRSFYFLNHRRKCRKPERRTSLGSVLGDPGQMCLSSVHLFMGQQACVQGQGDPAGLQRAWGQPPRCQHCGCWLIAKKAQQNQSEGSWAVSLVRGIWVGLPSLDFLGSLSRPVALLWDQL